MPIDSVPIAEAAGAEKITFKRGDGSDVPAYAFGEKGAPPVITVQVR
jgi:hypothetical protein